MIWIIIVLIALITYIIYAKMNDKIKAFCGFIGLNLLGNSIPIWFILLINIIEKGLSCDVIVGSVHQPFTFLVLGGTLLSNTLFLWQKDFSKNNIKVISTSMLIYIFISLPLFGYLFIKTYNLPNNEIPSGHYIASYIVSILAFIYFIKYQYKDFEIDWLTKNEMTPKAQEEKRKQSFENLEKSFNNFNEDGK